MKITTRNFRAILDDLGYYDGAELDGPSDVREYLTRDNLAMMFEEVPRFSDDELDYLGDLAIEHREHWA